MTAGIAINHNERNVHNEVLFQTGFDQGSNFSLFVFVVLVVPVVVRLLFPKPRP